jgi:monoamine oxidase
VEPDADAIVIGAGGAGLAAARRLAARSLRTIVLEARDRVGGRVASVPTTRAAVPAELGAEFIHGPAAETMALLREAGTAAIDNEPGDSWGPAANGELLRDDDAFATAAGIFEGVRGLGHDESVDRFLHRFDGDAKLRETVKRARSFAEGFDAADPAIASALSLADELRSGVDSTSARPLGGYAPMFAWLRDACVNAGVDLRLSATVRRVTWQRGSVAVDVLDEAGTARTVRARAAVITLPAGVLRYDGDDTAVVFEPVLPAVKRDALRYIEMGHVVKVMMWFRTAFWERLREGRYRNAAFFRGEGSAFAAYWTQYPVRSELIVAWAGGPKALALGALSESELIERALDGLGALFAEPALVRRELEGAAVHDWNHDPLSRGAYSYVAVNGGNAREVLAAPVDDTLFFAGEATSNDGQGGTVNGALETGERAAHEAVAALGRTR